MNKYVITSILSEDQKDAGSKAKQDARKILCDNEFHKIDLIVPKNRLKKFIYSQFKLPGILNKFKGNEFVIQYPLYSMYTIKKVVRLLKKQNKNVRIFLIVHDIESCRLRKNDRKYKENEINLFNSVDTLIVHTKNMQDKLFELGVNTPMVKLELFDYLTMVPVNKKSEYKGYICLAGNLKKNEFISKLTLKKSKLKLFGDPKPTDINNNIEYVGSYPANILPKYLNADFGLIWDGSSLKECNGLYGEYMEINAPHKTSLYLSSGMPVVVWKKAAIASFIEKNNLGILIDDLDTLDNVLINITQEQYSFLKENVLKYSKLLRSGYNLINAVNKCEEICQ